MPSSAKNEIPRFSLYTPRPLDQEAGKGGSPVPNPGSAQENTKPGTSLWAYTFPVGTLQRSPAARRSVAQLSGTTPATA